MKGFQVLIFFYLFYHTSLCLALDTVKKAKFDLNGDNKAETILISEITGCGDFVLKVDKISIKGQLSYKVDGLIIIDIDKADKYKEIAVYTLGPSDDVEYLIYWYDGKSIKEMGRLARWPKFLGNGIVLVDDWMGFWSKRDKYILNKKTRTLELVPQELYYVGIEATVERSFPIYKTRTGSKIVANLKPNSKILILVCDPSPDDYLSHWYLIKSETGLIGWTQERSLYDNVEGLPIAD